MTEMEREGMYILKIKDFLLNWMLVIKEREVSRMMSKIWA